MDLLKGLKEEKDRLTSKLRVVEAAIAGLSGTKPGGKRVVSEATRAKLRQKALARWKKAKK